MKMKCLRVESAGKQSDLPLVDLVAAAREPQTDVKLLEVEFPVLIVSIHVHHAECLSEIGANTRHTRIWWTECESRREYTVAISRLREFRESRRIDEAEESYRARRDRLIACLT